ncbi:MAG TPA: glycosyltransferase family 2 protein [Streptosporangiaceae bacterium]|nr:glycosyltransferase family 2 protein [Streptosporangiaceae bacterium]
MVRPNERADRAPTALQVPGAALDSLDPAVGSLPQSATAVHDRPVKLSILMCAYNEEQRIGRAIAELLQMDYPCDIELIVVDDGSTDGTPLLLGQIDDPRVIVYRHVVNLGKGAALRSAVKLATGTHAVPFDADLEYSPADLPRMLEPVLAGRSQVVYGARLFGFYTVYQSYRYAKGNRVMTQLANMIYDAGLSDLHTCLKLIPLPLLKTLPLSEIGFGLDTEITALLLKLGIRPFEIPVSYYSRSQAEGKKIRWQDAVACVRILVQVRMSFRSRMKSAVALAHGGGHASPAIPAPELPTRAVGESASGDVAAIVAAAGLTRWLGGGVLLA